MLNKSIQLYEEKYMRFPEGREKALTFSYDDGTVSDIKLLQVFKKYGLKGTFNLNSRCFGDEYRDWHGRMNEEQTYNAFKDCGQELALHGARHAFLTKIPLAEAMREVVDNREYMERVYGQIVNGMAYAYGAYNDEIVQMLRAAGVLYARTTEPSYSFAVPTDWLRLKPSVKHNDKKFLELKDKFLREKPSDLPKHRESFLFYVWGHAFEFDEENNWEIIEDFGKEVCGRKDIWFATNGEIYNYVQAYNRLVFSMDGERVYNPSACPVWIEVACKTYRVDGGATLCLNRG